MENSSKNGSQNRRHDAAQLVEGARGIQGDYMGPPVADAHHLLTCPGCGATFDARDLGAVLHHEFTGAGHAPMVEA